MPNPTRPGVTPIWTQGNNSQRVQPTNGEQFTGFTANFRPPAKWHNWLFGIFSDWIAWLDFVTNPASGTVTGSAAPSSAIALPTTTYLGDTTSAGYSVPLAAAAANAGLKCTFKNRGTANNMTITVQTGEKLENVTNGTINLGPGEAITIASDGATGYWQVNA